MATWSEWYRDFANGPHSRSDELPRMSYSGRLVAPPPGTSDAFASMSVKPPFFAVPTYAMSTETSHGSRRSNETFHEWIRLRDTSPAGVRIK